MQVIIKTIEHSEQRYDTVGDWQMTGDGLLITVSKMHDIRYELCVAVHELCEALMCIHKGVDQYSVDQFDINYEKNRGDNDTSEPGDSPLAPYNRQHIIATTIERILAGELDIDWNKYNETVNSLG